MRLSAHFFISATVLYGCSLAGTTYGDTYKTVKDYQKDIPPCIAGCTAFLIDYALNTCKSGTDMKCFCTTPEPDLNDKILAEVFNESEDCLKLCPIGELQKYETVDKKLNDTCQPYMADKPTTSVSFTYYQSQLGTHMPPTPLVSYPTGKGPSGSKTLLVTSPARNSTNPTSTVSGSGSKAATTPPGSVTSGPSGKSATTASATASAPAQQTKNAGAWNEAFGWEMTVGLPMVVSLVLSFGMRFF